MNKIKVLKPADYIPESKDCPICKLAFKHIEDIINYRKHGCCENCDVVYRYPNKEKWAEGWRPDN